jgi:hypothetical protein
MAAKKLLVGPVALTNTLGTNLYNQASALVRTIVRHVRVVNESDTDATFSIWLGLTGANTAGTALFSKETVKARSGLDRYMELPLTNAQFLVGGASVNSALTLLVEGELEAV